MESGPRHSDRVQVSKLVSGGQTGVDRGALDAAIALGLPHGGWCPLGRRAEDGAIPDRYVLCETDSRDYAVRTRRNVRDSDATLVLATGPLSGGTQLTARWATQQGKPCLVIELGEAERSEDEFAKKIRDWLAGEQVRVLNVAGPRASETPGIQRRTAALLERILGIA